MKVLEETDLEVFLLRPISSLILKGNEGVNPLV
jgi:hypothetical protein